MNKSLILHFRPKMVKGKAAEFTLTFGLGGMAFILMILLFGTGLLLKFYYLPVPDRAYDSIAFMNNNVLFGPFIRNIHYWSANILVIAVFLHFLRVFFTSAFHSSRKLNWVIGLALLIIILFSNFTGYLLPLDQLAFWAVTICTGMMEYIPWAGEWIQNLVRGGTEIGASTLSNFYAAHTVLLPAALIIILPFHFWRIRKAGGIVIQEHDKNNDSVVPLIPDLILKEFVTALVLTALILFLSIMFDAPLGEKANPGLSPNPTKAPWYFMGFQEILLHIHPLFAVCIIPVMILAGLVKAALGKYPAYNEGIWFISPKGRSMSFISLASALVFTVFAVILDEYFIDFTLWFPEMPKLISTGLVPFLMVFSVFITLYLILKKRFNPDKNEKVQAVFVFFLTAFIVLTITGIWFRGEGMKLVWPF